MIGWLSQPEVLGRFVDAEQLTGLVSAQRTVVHSFYGQVINGQAPVRSRRSVGKRVIVTIPSPGLSCLVDIDPGGTYDYDLGVSMSAFVLQELSDDLVDYLIETDLQTKTM